MRDRVKKYADGGAVVEPSPATSIEDPSIALAAQIEALKIAEQRAALEREIAVEQEKLRLNANARSLEEHEKAQRPAKAAVQPEQPDSPVEQALKASGLPPLAVSWLKDHSQFVLDPEQNQKIQAMHHELMDADFEAYSPMYWAEMESRLLDKPAAKADGGEMYQTENSRIVLDAPRHKRNDAHLPYQSSPISRSVPQANGQRHLSDDPRSVEMTPAMKEAAAIAGISQAEYARQVLRLREEKANGNYTGGQ